MLPALFRGQTSLFVRSRTATLGLVDACERWQSTTQAPARTEGLHFRDHATIFEGQSSASLWRAWFVFRLCTIGPFVNNAQTLMTLGYRILGQRATNALVKHTFFKHFCAGETPEEVYQTMKKMQTRGVSAILDYAAESDLSNEPASPKELKVAKREFEAFAHAGAKDTKEAVARVYDYVSEQQCDRHVETFLIAVDTAGSLPGQGFAAVKVTALGNPKLLKRISRAILTVRALFKRFDTDDSGFIDRQEYKAMYKVIYPGGSTKEAALLFAHYDQDFSGKVDYVAWCQGISLLRMPAIAESIVKAYDGKSEIMEEWLGDLSKICLTPEELELVEAMNGRLEKIAQRAVEKNVKLMVDAEHSYFQPAIDHMALLLMKKFNVDGRAVIFNTYQAYLTNVHNRMCHDMERAQREGYTFACKLVRGAYLVVERALAEQKGYPSPIWPTLEETHAAYNECLKSVINEAAAGRAEVMLGSHNEESIQLAVQQINELGIKASDSHIYFGQLMGMSDHLTFTLGRHGFPAFKYVPYGLVQEVIPYLLRRAQENSAMLAGAKADLTLVEAELRRRTRANFAWLGGRK